jgi:hypothetical protein
MLSNISKALMLNLVLTPITPEAISAGLSSSWSYDTVLNYFRSILEFEARFRFPILFRLGIQLMLFLSF